MEWCGGRDGGGEAFEMPKPHAKMPLQIGRPTFFETIRVPAGGSWGSHTDGSLRSARSRCGTNRRQPKTSDRETLRRARGHQEAGPVNGGRHPRRALFGAPDAQNILPHRPRVSPIFRE